MMQSNRNIIFSEHYIFWFDKKFTDARKETLVNRCESRFSELVQIIEPVNDKWKRAYYLFDLADNEDGVKGQTYKEAIKCNITLNYKKELPMVHEEAHMIVHQMIGEMPYAWSEGYAEYIVSMWQNNIAFLRGEKASFARLEYRKNTAQILDVLTVEDRELFNYFRGNDIFYAMSLASIIYFTNKILGKKIFENMQGFILKHEYANLKKFLKNEIFFQWLNWIEFNNR